MSPTFPRILRIVFAAVGTLAVLLSIGTAVAFAVLAPPVDTSVGIAGSAIYGAIGLVCLYAAHQLRPAAQNGGNSRSDMSIE